MIQFTTVEFIILISIIFTIVLGSFIIGVIFNKNTNKARHIKEDMPDEIQAEDDEWEDE